MTQFSPSQRLELSMPGTGRSLDFSPPRPLPAAGRRVFDPAVFRPKRWSSATPTSSLPTVRLLMQTPPAPARTPVAPQSSPGPPPGPVAGTFSVGLPGPHGPQQFILTRQRAECSSPNANQTPDPSAPAQLRISPEVLAAPRSSAISPALAASYLLSRLLFHGSVPSPRPSSGLHLLWPEPLPQKTSLRRELLPRRLVWGRPRRLLHEEEPAPGTAPSPRPAPIFIFIFTCLGTRHHLTLRVWWSCASAFHGGSAAA